ncbi:MAG: RNA polymerase sigma factor [Oscillospiraceae bacterium]|nr:RNA polymerase sigma factor [Oscillospiraceae bacterium]
MSNAEIAMLVEKVQGNKELYFEKLYEASWRNVYFRCYKILGDKRDAQDATQMIFLRLHNKFENLLSPNAFNKFMHTIITYTCSEILKSKMRGAKLHTDVDDIESHETAEEDNPEFLPSEAYDREDVRNELAKMIETLPSKQREAILYFYYDDLSIAEIAEITDSEISAVKNSLFRARKSLRERAEVLIEKGALTIPMVIVSVPIITKILMEEANAIVTAEVGAIVWQGVCAGIEISGAASAGTVAAEVVVAESVKTAGVFANIGIGVACAVVVAGVVYLGLYVNDTFINPPPAIVAEIEDYDAFDIVALIQEIESRAEFDEFVDLFGFLLLGGSRFGDRENMELYYLEEPNRFIYLGYTENQQAGFRVVFEVTDERLPITDEDIADWFARM